MSTGRKVPNRNGKGHSKNELLKVQDTFKSTSTCSTDGNPQTQRLVEWCKKEEVNGPIWLVLQKGDTGLIFTSRKSTCWHHIGFERWNILTESYSRTVSGPTPSNMPSVVYNSSALGGLPPRPSDNCSEVLPAAVKDSLNKDEQHPKATRKYNYFRKVIAEMGIVKGTQLLLLFNRILMTWLS